MKYLHLVGHVEGVWVSKVTHLQHIMKRIAERNDFTVVSSAFHQFEPHGATGVQVLAESHFSAHTYPEENKVYIDVFCCSENFDASFCSKTIEEEFVALSGVWEVVNRGD
jgi:S-adenosylmethionine decarboxylase proenzyme